MIFGDPICDIRDTGNGLKGGPDQRPVVFPPKIFVNFLEDR